MVLAKRFNEGMIRLLDAAELLNYDVVAIDVRYGDSDPYDFNPALRPPFDDSRRRLESSTFVYEVRVRLADGRDLSRTVSRKDLIEQP